MLNSFLHENGLLFGHTFFGNGHRETHHNNIGLKSLTSIFSEVKHYRSLLFTLALCLNDPSIVSMIKNEVHKRRYKNIGPNNSLHLLAGLIIYTLQYNCQSIKAEIALKSPGKSKTMLAIEQAFSFARQHGMAHSWFPRKNAMSKLCRGAQNAGVETSYTNMLVRKLDLPPIRSHITQEPRSQGIRICTLSKFSITVNGQPIDFNKRIRKTPFTMLKILIAMGGRGVSASLINDLLWPEAIGDEVFNRHKITLHRLKKILGHNDAIVASQGQLSLSPNVCSVDLWEIEKLFRKISDCFCTPGQQDNFRHSGKQAGNELMSKMIGIFLPDNNELWAVKCREIIKQKYIFCLYSIASVYEKTKDVWSAIKIYKKGLSIYPEVESIYQRLIYCYILVGKPSEAEATYNKCEKMLSMHYALVPSKKTTQLIC